MTEQLRLAPDGPIRSIFAFPPFRLDVRRRSLLCGAQAVTITPQEFDALHILVARAGEIVSKDDLAWRLGSHDAPLSDASLTQATYRLRRTLESCHAAEYIATIPRQGYQFVFPVEESSESEGPGGGSDATFYLLQKAKQNLTFRSSAEDVDAAITMLTEVTENAPENAAAFAALAEAHLELAADFFRDPLVQHPLAEAAALRALSLDSFQPNATCALAESAMAFHHDWKRALTLLLQAARSSARAQWTLAFYYALRGEFEQAKNHGRKLLNSQPSDFRIYAMMGAIHFFSGEPAMAELYLRDALNGMPGEPYFRHMLAQVLWMLGQPDDALQLLIDLHEKRPTPLLCGPLGYISAKIGDDAQARRCLEHLREAKPGCIIPYRHVALVQLSLSDYQAALESLEAAYDHRDSSLCSLAVHALFSPLREFPRFELLLSKLGLPNSARIAQRPA